MVTLIDIKRTYGDGGMRLELLADSKEDVLPTQLADVPGITGAGRITPGSICRRWRYIKNQEAGTDTGRIINCLAEK